MERNFCALCNGVELGILSVLDIKEKYSWSEGITEG
jgi:hypothetical protein